MEKLYQLYIIGGTLTVSETFKCFSKKVYKHYPTEEEQKEFLERCKPQSEADWFALDIRKPYTLNIVELEIVD